MSFAPAFDAEFRARLRVLLAWRRDVRRFRCDPLPEGAVERLLELACLAPSVGLSQPWRFVLVNDPSRRAKVRRNFAACNAEALADQTPERAAQYARLKLAGLDDAPCHIAVFADRETTQGHRLGRYTICSVWERIAEPIWASGTCRTNRPDARPQPHRRTFSPHPLHPRDHPHTPYAPLRVRAWPGRFTQAR